MAQRKHQSQNRLYRITKETFSNRSMTASLSKGIAERLFRETYKHNMLFVENWSGISCTSQIEKYIVGQLSYGTQGLNRKRAASHVTHLFMNAVKCDGRLYEDNQHNTTSAYGTIVVEDKLFIVKLILNNKKPHQSIVTKVYVGITKHALARIIYRYKPASLLATLAKLSIILSQIDDEMGLHTDLVEGGSKWVILNEHGGFLFGKCDNDIVLITFINENLMSTTQRWEGQKNINYLQENAPELIETLESFAKNYSIERESDLCEITNISPI